MNKESARVVTELLLIRYEHILREGVVLNVFNKDTVDTQSIYETYFKNKPKKIDTDLFFTIADIMNDGVKGDSLSNITKQFFNETINGLFAGCVNKDETLLDEKRSQFKIAYDNFHERCYGVFSEALSAEGITEDIAVESVTRPSFAFFIYKSMPAVLYGVISGALPAGTEITSMLFNDVKSHTVVPMSVKNICRKTDGRYYLDITDPADIRYIICALDCFSFHDSVFKHLFNAKLNGYVKEA